MKELRVMSINIPWLEVLKACYPNAQITEDTEILVVSPQYTADIAVIMSTTDRWVYIYSSQRTFGEVFTIIEKAATRVFSWFKAQVALRQDTMLTNPPLRLLPNFKSTYSGLKPI